MSSSVVAIITTVVLVLLIAGITALVWTRNRSKKALVVGIGTAVLPIGLAFTSIMRILVEGITALIKTPFDWKMWTGIGLLVAGVLTILVGTRLSSDPVEPTQAVPEKKASRKKIRGKNKAVVGPGEPQPANTPQISLEDDNFDDIEAILKSRGIE